MNLIAKDTVWLTERKGIKAKVVFEKFRRRMNVLYMTICVLYNIRKVRILGGTVSLT